MITTNLCSITGAAIVHWRGRVAEQPAPIERVLITVFFFPLWWAASGKASKGERDLLA